MEMETSFRYTNADFVTAIRAHLLWRCGYWFVALLGVLAICGAAVLQTYLPRLLPISLTVLLMGILWISCPFILPFFYARTMRRLHDDDQFWQFTEDFILYKSTLSEGKLKWEFFGFAYESKDSFLLYFSRQPKMFNLLPKRAFADESKESSFRALLTSKGLLKQSKKL